MDENIKGLLLAIVFAMVIMPMSITTLTTIFDKEKQTTLLFIEYLGKIIILILLFNLFYKIL